MTLDELRALATGKRGEYTVWEGDLGKMAVTLEDADFLYALVRVTKPRRILELGTGLGVSTRFLVEALIENDGDYDLLTVEPDETVARAAAANLADLNVGMLTKPPSPDYVPDLVFVDSGWQTRQADIKKWLTGSYRGLVVVHDAARDYPELALGRGVFLPGSDGLWVGTAA